jgi:hypothetical protein
MRNLVKRERFGVEGISICVTRKQKVVLTTKSLLHAVIAIESERDSDCESQDADRFIVQSTLGIIQDCMTDDPDPRNVDDDVQDKQVDEHTSSLSAGLGEHYQLSGITKLI